MFRRFEESEIGLIEGRECEVIIASEALDQLHVRMIAVRRGDCDDVDLMVLRERRIATLGGRDGDQAAPTSAEQHGQVGLVAELKPDHLRFLVNKRIRTTAAAKIVAQVIAFSPM